MNSQRGPVSTITIILLVVGLVVGAAGGYFMISSSLQPKIDDYEAQVADLNSEVSGLSATVSSLEDEIVGYESQVFHLIEEIMVLETLTSDMQSELDELEQTIKDHEATASASAQILTVYESQIADLEKEILAYRSDLVWLATEVERLQALLETEEENGTFTAFGWSFDYPEDWKLSLYGMLEYEPTENSGVVLVMSLDEEMGYSVGWLYLIDIPKLEETIDDCLDTMIEELPGIELEERVSVYGAEHFQKYQCGTLAGSEFLFTAWYCDVSDYAFIITLVALEPTDMFEYLCTFMESFECHSDPGLSTPSYSGSLDPWYHYMDVSTEEITTQYDAKLIDGSWSIVDLGNGVFRLSMRWTELNIDEEVEGAPPGTYDKFTVTLESQDINVVEDMFMLYGDAYWQKINWDGTTGGWTSLGAEILIIPNSYEYQFLYYHSGVVGDAVLIYGSFYPS